MALTYALLRRPSACSGKPIAVFQEGTRRSTRQIQSKSGRQWLAPAYAGGSLRDHWRKQTQYAQKTLLKIKIRDQLRAKKYSIVLKYSDVLSGAGFLQSELENRTEAGKITVLRAGKLF